MKRIMDCRVKPSNDGGAQAYRKLALNCSSAAWPGQSSFSLSALSGVATVREGLSIREISEAELRSCMLPDMVELDDGRRVSLAEFRKSHFQRGTAARG